MEPWQQPEAHFQINKGMASLKQNQGFEMVQPESRSKANWKSVGCPEDAHAHKMPSQFDRVRMLLQGRMAKYCEVRMCQTDWLLPKKRLNAKKKFKGASTKY